MIPPPLAEMPADLALSTTYELDPFQKHAVRAIHNGHHVFVTAKTGSGKTFVGEYLIAYHLRKGGRIFYTTPIKSLSNQKYHDLKQLFPDATVGIMTGDIKMCPQAQIIVMTAEILRNLLFKRGTATESVGNTSALSLCGVSAIVMDEVHFIQDPERGHVWEETLILLAPSSAPLASPSPPSDVVSPSVVVPPYQIVLLSATLSSAPALANWLADLHQVPTTLLTTTYRIVPLTFAIQSPRPRGDGIRPLLDSNGSWTDAYSNWLRERKIIADAVRAHKKAIEARRRDGYSAPPPKDGVAHEETPVARLLRTVSWLETTSNLPALFFIFSRKECERLATLVPQTLLDTSDAAIVNHLISFHLSRYRDFLDTSPQFHTLRDLLLRGIGFHHSGLQPLLKEIVEILFARGYIKILFATETFAVGLNMPTRTVVFLGLEKFTNSDGEAGPGQRLLRPDEFLQMAGRAGRRGKDTQGLVLYEPMRDPVDAHELKELLTGGLPALSSRMRFHYDFILKTRMNPVRLVDQSYWAQEQKRNRATLQKEIDIVNRYLVSASIGMTPLEETIMAEYAKLQEEIRTTVNAKQKRAKQALVQWTSANDSKDLQTRIKRYEDIQMLRKDYERLTEDARVWDTSPLLDLSPLETCLRTWQFIDKDRSINGLTRRGVCATESNEGHPILMPLLADSEKMTGFSGEEIAVVLATFLQEGGEPECVTDVDNLVLGARVTEALRWIEGKRQDCISIEASCEVVSPNNFWKLSALWPMVVHQWISVCDSVSVSKRDEISFSDSVSDEKSVCDSDEKSKNRVSLSKIAADFGMFEGNIQRALMRVANLLEEWKSIATIRNDLATLESLSKLVFLRGEVVSDSLYLRL